MASAHLINTARLSQIRISKINVDRPTVTVKNGSSLISVSHRITKQLQNPKKLIVVVNVNIEGENEESKDKSPEFSMFIEARGIITFDFEVSEIYKDFSIDTKEMLIQPIYLHLKNYAEIILNSMHIGNVGLELDIRTYRDLENEKTEPQKKSRSNRKKIDNQI